MIESGERRCDQLEACLCVRSSSLIHVDAGRFLALVEVYLIAGAARQGNCLDGIVFGFWRVERVDWEQSSGVGKRDFTSGSQASLDGPDGLVGFDDLGLFIAH